VRGGLAPGRTSGSRVRYRGSGPGEGGAATSFLVSSGRFRARRCCREVRSHLPSRLGPGTSSGFVRSGRSFSTITLNPLQSAPGGQPRPRGGRCSLRWPHTQTEPRRARATRFRDGVACPPRSARSDRRSARATARAQPPRGLPNGSRGRSRFRPSSKAAARQRQEVRTIGGGNDPHGVRSNSLNGASFGSPHLPSSSETRCKGCPSKVWITGSSEIRTL
jgi:hypothetical protein